MNKGIQHDSARCWVCICPECTVAFSGCQIKFSMTGIFSVICNYWFLFTFYMRINNNDLSLLQICPYTLRNTFYPATSNIWVKVFLLSVGNLRQGSFPPPVIGEFQYMVFMYSIENHWCMASVGVERTSAEPEVFEGIDTGLIFAVCLEVCFSTFRKPLWKSADFWRGGCTCLSVHQ